MIKYDQIFKNDESSSEHHDFAYKAYIKKIFLEVPDYTYHHHPHQDDSEDSDPKHIFMGREDIKARFLDILLKGKVNGVYLVTGYRGMGKTSFVNKVIEEYSKIEKKEVCKIKISLAQSKLEEIDILRYIVKALLDDIKKDNVQIFKFFQDAIPWLKLLLICFVVFSLIDLFNYANVLKYIKIIFLGDITILSYLILMLLLSAIIKYGLNIIFEFIKLPIIIHNSILNFYDIYSLRKKLESLYERSYSSTSEEESQSFLIKEIFSLFRKKAKVYPIAAAKEIEYEIIDILKEFNHKKVIFVFDELDKVEPTQDRGLYQTYSSEELSAKTNLNDLRDRKHIILKVLSSMKHLLTEAKARFIFIAGREMFDASLADISDRQSLLGSIIHQTFYVESFLHENPASSFSQENSLSIYIEKYLEKILLPASKLPKGLLIKEDSFLRKYALYLYYLKEKDKTIKNNVFFYKSVSYFNLIFKKDETASLIDTIRKTEINDENIIKIIFTLQNYIYYLTYRSSGSPKKLIKLIEEHLFVVNEEKIENQSNQTRNSFYVNNKRIMVRGVKFTPKKNRLYLTLSYKQQYKIAFNAYLFYPFLSVQNNILINYSDNTIVSTPYIMDNIMKFHPFAFSIHNLELFPEILSTNKSPELRFFIEELIRYLNNNFVRETEVGLFQYKFFDKVHNEISYLSKISAEESAAFNFSLDENYSTKTHIAAKIVLLRSVYKDFKKKDNSSVESLMFLNDMLGDSQLFDEYYDDAIIALSDIIHDVPIPIFKAGTGASIEFFLLWMRVKLKIAMVFEKMKHYDMAIGHLGVAMDASVAYLKEIKNLKENEKTPLYRELLYITQQAILNCLYVQEKFGEGITFIKLERYVSLFLEIEESEFYQKYRGRDMLLGIFYTQIGILLYFKNKTLPLWKSFEIHNIAKENKKKVAPQKIIREISKVNFFQLLGNEDSKNLLLKSSYTEIYDFLNFYEDVRRDFRFSFTTYITYKKSLMTFLAISPNDNSNGEEYMLESMISTSIVIIRGDRFINVHNSRKLIAIANIITRITDLLLTLYKNSEDYNIKNEYLYELINDRMFNGNEYNDDTVKLLDKLLLEENKSPKSRKIVSISNIIKFYYLAGRFYIKAGRNVAFMFQLKKMLLVFQTTKFIDLVAEESEDKRKNYERLFEVLVNKILEINSWNANNSDGPQLTIINRVLGFKNRDYRYDLIKHLSNNPDTKEAIILFFSLKLKLNSYNTEDWNKLLKILRKELQITSQSNSIAHQSIRVMELSLQLQINYTLIEKYFTKKKLVILEENKSISISNTINADDFKRYTELITNSLFCINQIITISSIYGINYMQSYSYFGSFYHKMGHWVKHYKECIKLLDISNNDKFKEIIGNMNEDLKMLIGNTILQNLGEPCDYYQMALQYYHKAIQMHSEGSPYREQMNNMIFSEDDYSDNLSHFGAAIERQMINSGRLREKIDKLSKEVERSC